MPASRQWWHDAVIYQVYLRSFADGTGDGIGDLAGLAERLPYLVDLGDGRALAVDPPRLPTNHLAAARADGLEIAFTADTHSHADFISGSPELAARGATFLASKDARLETPHHDVAPGAEVELRAGLILRAIATPGTKSMK